MKRYRLLAANIIVLLAVLGSHYGRALEGSSLSQPDFLKNLPLDFHGWKTTDSVLPSSQMALLEPDAMLLRRYQSPDEQTVEFTVIAGHRKKTVHTPSQCMTSDGWETTQEKALDIQLPNQVVHATRSFMYKDGQELVTTYAFTDGEYSVGNLSRFQVVQLMKRFRAQLPIGALVRIIVPVTKDRGSAERLSDEFIQQNLPTIMAALHGAHLTAH